MTTEGDIGLAREGHPFLGFLVLVSAILVVMIALGLVPTRKLAGDEAVIAMLAGCGISLLGSLIGALPVTLARNAAPAQRITAVTASIALRLALVLALGAAVAISGRLATSPFLIWLVLSYVGLLIADTRYSLRALQSNRQLPQYSKE